MRVGGLFKVVLGKVGGHVKEHFTLTIEQSELG